MDRWVQKYITDMTVVQKPSYASEMISLLVVDGIPRSRRIMHKGPPYPTLPRTVVENHGHGHPVDLRNEPCGTSGVRFSPGNGKRYWLPRSFSW